MKVVARQLLDCLHFLRSVRAFCQKRLFVNRKCKHMVLYMQRCFVCRQESSTATSSRRICLCPSTACSSCAILALQELLTAQEVSTPIMSPPGGIALLSCWSEMRHTTGQKKSKRKSSVKQNPIMFWTDLVSLRLQNWKTPQSALYPETLCLSSYSRQHCI